MEGRQGALKTHTDAWWAAQPRPEKPAHLWEEVSQVYEEQLQRRSCRACGFFRCQCAELAGSAATANKNIADESDAYELDQERELEEQGRVSAIHGRGLGTRCPAVRRCPSIGSTT